MVGLAVLSALLVVPRPVAPDDVPLPRVDRGLQARLREQSARLAAAAVAEPLPYEVRAVGEAVRRFGRASKHEQGYLLAQVTQDMPHLVRLARDAHGDEPLLRLRAVQERLFTDAVARWQGGASAGADLFELGGAFVREARMNGWLTHEDRLALSPSDLPSLFRVRWTALTGLLEQPAFAPTLNDWRAHYRARLAHTPATPDGLSSQIAAVRALAEHDPEYPAQLTLGVLSYRGGRFAEAAVHFDAHLQAHPSGRWYLRARNYLTAAMTASGQL